MQTIAETEMWNASMKKQTAW